MLKVLEHCVYSLYWASRYNVFLKKKPMFRSNLVFRSGLSVFRTLKVNFFFSSQKKRLIQGKFILFAMKLGVQEPPRAREWNNFWVFFFFFCSEMFLNKLHIWLKDLFCDLGVIVVFLVIICSSPHPLCHRLEHIPDETILLLRQHLEIFSMQFQHIITIQSKVSFHYLLLCHHEENVTLTLSL